MYIKNYSTKSVKIIKIKAEILESIHNNSQDEDYQAIKSILRRVSSANNETRFVDKDIDYSITELIRAKELDPNIRYTYLKYRYRFKSYPSSRRLGKYPIVLAIEASAMCNLKCVMCFQSNADFKKVTRVAKVMKLETYTTLLNQFKKCEIPAFVFASRGEPLLNNNIDKMIRLAKEKGVIDVKLNTNGQLLTPVLARRLIESGLDLIVFSIDSIRKETYKKIRGSDLDKVINNISTLKQIRDSEYPQSKLKIRIAKIIIKNLNDSETEEETRIFWKNISDEVSIKQENDFKGIYFGSAEPNMQLHPCSLLWERLYIWADGTINPCDIDYLSKLRLGNVKTTTIDQVWSGDTLSTLRKAHLENRRNCPIPCSKCRGY